MEKNFEKMDFSKKAIFELNRIHIEKNSIFFRQKQVDLARKHIYKGFSMRGIDCKRYFDQKNFP